MPFSQLTSLSNTTEPQLEDDLQEVVDRLKNGESLSGIARDLGASRYVLRARLIKNNVNVRAITMRTAPFDYDELHRFISEHGPKANDFAAQNGTTAGTVFYYLKRDLNQTSLVDFHREYKPS